MDDIVKFGPLVAMMLVPRMAELEERLDFAERLLGNRAPNEQLGGGADRRG